MYSVCALLLNDTTYLILYRLVSPLNGHFGKKLRTRISFSWFLSPVISRHSMWLLVLLYSPFISFCYETFCIMIMWIFITIEGEKGGCCLFPQWSARQALFEFENMVNSITWWKTVKSDKCMKLKKKQWNKVVCFSLIFLINLT